MISAMFQTWDEIPASIAGVTAAERRANEIELDIRAGIHGRKSTIPSFAEW